MIGSSIVIEILLPFMTLNGHTAKKIIIHLIVIICYHIYIFIYLVRS